MTILFNVFILLVTCNFYWLLLPTLKMQKRLVRITILVFLALLTVPIPILIFLYIALGFWWTVYLLLMNIVKGKKSRFIFRIVLIGLCIVLAPITALYLFGMMFFGNDYDYYATYSIVIYLFTFTWALIKDRDWVKKRFKTASCFFLIFPLLFLSLHWGYRHNPTTYFHTETVKLGQKTTTYRNKDILKLLKKVEQLIAIDIYSQFKNVHFIRFLSIHEQADFRQGGYSGRFVASILVNHQDEVTYYFNLSYSEDDYAPNFIEGSSYSDNMQLEANYESVSPIHSIEQLTDPDSQKVLENINIHYYLKNDIYKDN